MTVKSPSQWQAPKGIGYVNITNDNVYLNPVGSESPLADIGDNHGNTIVTNLGVGIQISPNVFTFKSPTLWGPDNYINNGAEYVGKSPSQWIPKGGWGYVYTNLNYEAAGQQGVPIVPGTNNITDSLGNFLIDNSGNYIVTNPIIVVGKFLTLWNNTGV